jgi:hypothetical protein
MMFYMKNSKKIITNKKHKNKEKIAKTQNTINPFLAGSASALSKLINVLIPK